MAETAQTAARNRRPAVPAPPAPDDADAWYAPDVRAQREVHPGVVATVREVSDGQQRQYRYEVREPRQSAAEEAAIARVADHFADASLRRPRTREGCVERAAAGLAGKYRRAVDRLVDCSHAARRRVDYYALRDLRLFGPVTPLALDDAVEVGDATGDRLSVHTEAYAPAETAFDADAAFLDRVVSERLDRHRVQFREFDVPVVLYRERLLGGDAFEVKYAVLEPALLPGDEELIAACKDRIWEANVDGVVDDRAAVVRERARSFLRRQLTARNAEAWLGTVRHRLRSVLADYDLAVPPADDRYSPERLDDLIYYVLRDFVGHDKLTVPVRDDRLEDVEANRVGERVKVVPRAAYHDGRVPTNLVFEDERRFENLVTQLAAADGEELTASNPHAKVNLDPAEVDDAETIRCAVALPTISEDGPHISIRKQAADPLTPVDLVERGALPTELVALLWLCYERHAVVLFSGPTGVGKTTLMNAHMPFVPYDDRPVSIDEGSREVRLPQETGVSLTTRDHENEFKRVTMADLMTQANYLNPDVEVVAEVNSPASFQTFAEAMQTGHGLIGTTHAEDVATFVNRAIEQGLPAYLLSEIDLVVFPRHVGGQRYVGEAVEFVASGEATDATESVERPEATVHYDRVCWRTPDGDYAFAHDTADGDAPWFHLFDRLAERENRDPSAVADEFRRKHRYVAYLVEEGIDDFEALFDFLSDLQDEEAATVERIRGGRE
ncbi:MAG: type II/IV secretion system ATPase subunit [Halobacteriaceae archaeon]